MGSWRNTSFLFKKKKKSSFSGIKFFNVYFIYLLFLNMRKEEEGKRKEEMVMEVASDGGNHWEGERKEYQEFRKSKNKKNIKKITKLKKNS